MSNDEDMYGYVSSGSDVGSVSDEDMIDGTQESDDSSAGDLSDIDYNFETPVPNKGKGRQKSFEVEAESMTPKDLESAMRKEAEYLASLFGTNVSTVYVLLRHLAWNKERLIETFMDDPSKVMAAAGVAESPAEGTIVEESQASSALRRSSRRNTAGTSRSTGGLINSQHKQEETFMCPVCCDDEPTKILSLGCGHAYCSNCWQTYLHTKIRDQGEVAIRCMDDSCGIQTDDVFVRQNSAPEDFSRYMEILIGDFVANTPQLKFCPHPGCVYALSCPGAAGKNALLTLVPTVHCSDKHDFCFGCSQPGGHQPVICSVAKMWLKKCADDSETANWIKSNTKECPKCQSTIEKNGGCNHMTCKKCKYEFCWVCMGNWTEHGNSWYSCNRYDEKDGTEARDSQSKSRASLERYLHYYNRWANHEQSARLSLDLYAKTEKKMEEMQITSNLTWIEVQFARKAVDEIIKCRMTLKWTYAMAYYLEKTNFKDIFEDNQADLEKAVEDLSELLESPIEPDTITTLRQKMTDKTVYVSKRNDIVLEDTAKGFAEGRWTWNQNL